MKQSVKGVLASLGISTLIAGGSLPLMAADNTASSQVKAGKAGKRCAGMKKAAPVIKGGNPAISSPVELTDNPAGRRCGGLKPAVKADAPVKVAQ